MRIFFCCPVRKRDPLVSKMDQPKRMTAYRRTLKDHVQCPECGRNMTIRSLHYRHKCKSAEPPPAKLENMRQKAAEAAKAAHARRMAKLRGE